MSQFDFNHWSFVLQCLSLVVSILVGIIVFYYTCETHQLRVSTQEQVGLLRKQARMSVRPFVTGRLQSPERAIDQTDTHCVLWNATNNVAHQINALAKAGGDHFWSEKPLDFLPLSVDRHTRLDLTQMPRQQVFGSVNTAYGHEANTLLSRINDNEDYLALLFRNTNGDLLCAWRYVRARHEHGPIRIEEA